MVEFALGDRMAKGYLAVPSSGHGSGVLVLHAWWGLTPVFEAVCDRLAEEGFVALAPDLHRGKTATTIPEAEKLMEELDGDQAYQTIAWAMEFLGTHPAVAAPQIGVVGFSMGAAWALLLEAPVVATVVFYGTTDPQRITAGAACQGHFAENDPYEPAEGVHAVEDRLRATGREVQFYTYPGTTHWFFESNRPEYNPAAAGIAWQRTVEFLRARLG